MVLLQLRTLRALAELPQQRCEAHGIVVVRHVAGVREHLEAAARHRGMRGRAVKGDWDGLTKVPLPAIVHVKNAAGLGHYVVVHRVTANSVVVAASSATTVIQWLEAAISSTWLAGAARVTKVTIAPAAKHPPDRAPLGAARPPTLVVWDLETFPAAGLPQVGLTG